MTSVPHSAPATANPATTRLSLKLLAPVCGYVDGGWWPYSRDLAAEAPGLAVTVAARLGSVHRIAYALDAWQTAPRHIEVRGAGGMRQTVMLVGFASQDPNVVLVSVVLVSGVSERTLSLLVVPPEAADRAGHDAITRAAHPGNAETPATLLSAAGVQPAPALPGPAAPTTSHRAAPRRDHKVDLASRGPTESAKPLESLARATPAAVTEGATVTGPQPTQPAPLPDQHPCRLPGRLAGRPVAGHRRAAHPREHVRDQQVRESSSGTSSSARVRPRELVRDQRAYIHLHPRAPTDTDTGLLA